MLTTSWKRCLLTKLLTSDVSPARSPENKSMGESDALGLIRRASNSFPTSKFPISLSSPRATEWNKLVNSQYLEPSDGENVPICPCKLSLEKSYLNGKQRSSHSKKSWNIDTQEAEEACGKQNLRIKTGPLITTISNSDGVCLFQLY